MAHYTLDCAESRDRPPDPRDATIAQLEADVAALVKTIDTMQCPITQGEWEHCRAAFDAALPIIERYRAAQREATGDE